jgi:ATP-dependent DNA ligase
VVEAVRSCRIGGEVCCNGHGVTVFSVLRRGGSEVHAFLYAFDLLGLNGMDLRREPIEVRKAPPPLLLSNRCRGA